MPAKQTEQVTEFLKTLQHLSPHTRDAYARDLKVLLQYCQKNGISTWQQLDATRLRHYIAGRHRQGLSGRSLQRNLSAIRAFFRYLSERGVADHNPTQGLTPPKSERRLPNVLDVDQAGQLLNMQDDEPIALRDRAILELIYSSGLRLSEVVGLNLENLDFADAVVTVLGKGKKMRVVPMGKQAMAALKRWLKVRDKFSASGEMALFLSKRGARISPRTIQQRLKQWAIRQGIEGRVHPHMLRHSFASHMLESSGDLRAVQELLGHADISTTQVYTHLDFQHLAKIYDEAHPRARKKT